MFAGLVTDKKKNKVYQTMLYAGRFIAGEYCITGKG
jgi:hypothetical protein